QLSWKSAPRQTPSYIDGYSVLISTTDNNESSFTDVAFQAGQYLTGQGPLYSAYTFSTGFVHGEDGTYIQPDPTATDASFGEQRPFTYSISQYQGKTIYIAFLHDADDDNLISLDDILVTGTFASLSENAADVALSVFPNPAVEKVELSYILEKTGQVYAEIYDAKGAKVMDISRGFQIAGNQKLSINVASLQAGIYNVVLNAAGKSVSAKFVKQ
ncbi:MAG: T9SS type A sorting domain-containing protein, partial [Bacteroidota bacterium]